MAPDLPYRRQPLVLGRPGAIAQSVHLTSGMLMFRHQSQTGPATHTVFDNGAVRFSPFLLKGTDPYLEIEVLSRSGVTQEYSGKKPRFVTIIPLAKCAYVAVECEKLKRLPEVSNRLSSVLRHRADSDKPYVLNIHLHGLRVAKLNCYGNNYEDMDKEARRVLDMFIEDLETLEIEVYIEARSMSTLKKVPQFQKVCNAITIIRNPTLQLSLYTTKAFKKKIDPKTPGSPLYNLMGPGQRPVSLKYAKKCVARCNVIAELFLRRQISEDRIWEIVEQINAGRATFAKD